MFDLNKKEKPFTSFGGFGGGGLGLAGGGISAKTYVDEVFSTFLYEGNGGTQSINNGIDLAGEGGLVWFKKRNGSTYAGLWDTARGVTKRLRPDNSNAESDASNIVTAFNSNGVSISATGGTQINNNNDDYVSWTFRKAPGFFDIQTWTGNGAARTIAHNLGSVPGMILVKPVGFAENWKVWHRNLPNTATDFLTLNETGSKESSSTIWNNTAPTSTHFSLGNNLAVNGGGNSDYTYIAYIFAHDDAQYGKSGNESIIKCGTYTGNGSSTTPVVSNLGFEPQFILIKRSNNSGGWYLFDSMRGINTGSVEPTLQTQETNAEAADNNGNIALTATGFQTEADGVGTNASGSTYIYMAIRRPHKPPEAAINVFAMDTRSGTSPTPPTYKSGFPVDWVWERAINTTNNWSARTRLTGNGKEFDLNLTSAEGSNSNTRIEFDRNDGLGTDTTVDSNRHAWMFKRAPGFFDIVTFIGNSASSQNVSHNLGAVPEMMIFKNRQSNFDWNVYHASLGNNKALVLNDTSVPGSSTTTAWNNTTPTASVFSVGDNAYSNQGSQPIVAYLFATLAGISKVGSYSGTGSANNIDCGFAASARFVLIKRADSTGDWFVFDTTRGMVSGNDFFLKLNTTAAQTGGDDYIDPYATGFTINGTYSGLNASGGTYIFLAIA